MIGGFSQFGQCPRLSRFWAGMASLICSGHLSAVFALTQHWTTLGQHSLFVSTAALLHWNDNQGGFIEVDTAILSCHQSILMHIVEPCGRQHFSTTSLQNNATYSISKIKLPNCVCILVSFWLICMTKIVGLDKFLEIDQYTKT